MKGYNIHSDKKWRSVDERRTHVAVTLCLAFERLHDRLDGAKPRAGRGWGAPHLFDRRKTHSCKFLRTSYLFAFTTRLSRTSGRRSGDPAKGMG